MAENAPITPDQAAQVAHSDTVQDKAFFEYTTPTGEKESYKSPEDLQRAYRESFLRQSDYTRKTQEVASARKQHEEERKKFQEEQKVFLEQRKKWDEYDQLLKSRPDIYQQLEQFATRPADPSVAYQRSKEYADETKTALEKRIEELEGKFSEDMTKRELEQEFSALKAKYSDFDETAVMTQLETLADGKTGPLLDRLYWANKGQMTPAEVEQRVTQNLAKKAQARMVPAGGSVAKSPTKFKNIQEARDAAMADQGLTGG